MNYLVHHFKVLKDYFLDYDATNDDDAGIKNNRKYFLPRAGRLKIITY